MFVVEFFFGWHMACHRLRDRLIDWFESLSGWIMMATNRDYDGHKIDGHSNHGHQGRRYGGLEQLLCALPHITHPKTSSTILAAFVVIGNRHCHGCGRYCYGCYCLGHTLYRPISYGVIFCSFILHMACVTAHTIRCLSILSSPLSPL